MSTNPKKQPWWKRIAQALVILVIIVLFLGYISTKYLMAKPWFWAMQIRTYEKQDRKQFPKPGQILFVGSSSIRYWKTLKQDMAPLPVINRGFGGAHLSHVNHYAQRIVFPYKPKIIVLYAGENDISHGKPASQVLSDLKVFIQSVAKNLPKVPIYYLSIKPSVLRWKTWKTMQAANQQLKAYVVQTPGVEWVDVSSSMFLPNGKVRKDLFVWDRLHMNAKGYNLWTTVLKPRLLKAWKTTSASTKPSR